VCELTLQPPTQQGALRVAPCATVAMCQGSERRTFPRPRLATRQFNDSMTPWPSQIAAPHFAALVADFGSKASIIDNIVVNLDAALD